MKSTPRKLKEYIELAKQAGEFDNPEVKKLLDLIASGVEKQAFYTVLGLKLRRKAAEALLKGDPFNHHLIKQEDFPHDGDGVFIGYIER